MFKKKQRQNKRLKKLEKVRKSKGRRFDWIVCPLTIRICRDAGKGSVRDLSERMPIKERVSVLSGIHIRDSACLFSKL